MLGKRSALRLRGVCILVGLLGLGAVQGHVPASAQGKKVAATVNGDTITEGEFFERLQRIRGQDFLLPTSPPQLRTETAGQIVLNSMINERLILQAVTKAGIAPADADVNTELETLKKQPNVSQALTEHLITEDDLKYDIRVQRSRFSLATHGFTVTPQDVEAYYKAHTADYTVPERWGLSVIRTTKAEDRPKIESDLKAGKAFDLVARIYSDEQRSRVNGGSLGIVPANDPNVPAPIRDAIKNLKVGEVSAPIELDLNMGPDKPKVTTWWYVQLSSKQPESVRPLADIKSQIERLALLEKAGGPQALDKKMTEIRQQAQIKINLPGYDSLLTPPKKS